MIFKENGTSYGRYTTRKYTMTYTQPLHNFVIAWLFHHIWEKSTWRIYRLIEERLPEGDSLTWLPLTARQDCKCYELQTKNRTVVSYVYDS